METPERLVIRLALTDMAIGNARPGTKPIKLAEGGGVLLIVTPAGRRFRRLEYRGEGRVKLLWGRSVALHFRTGFDRRGAGGPGDACGPAAGSRHLLVACDLGPRPGRGDGSARAGYGAPVSGRRRAGEQCEPGGGSPAVKLCPPGKPLIEKALLPAWNRDRCG